MDIKEIRRKRLRQLIDERFQGKQVGLARLIDKQPDYISRCLKGTKGIGEDMAREVESKAGLTNYWLDNIESIDAHVEGQILNVTAALLHQVPLISWVKAGEFCEAIDLLQPGDCERMIDTKWVKRRHTYALRVIGDSMEPRFPEGTILIVEPDMALEHGHFVIAKMGNEATFKQAKLDGTQWWLCPLNERYLPIKVTEDIHICGIAVYAQREDKLV